MHLACLYLVLLQGVVGVLRGFYLQQVVRGSSVRLIKFKHDNRKVTKYLYETLWNKTVPEIAELKL